MPFRLIPLPAFADNYIWTLQRDDGCALIVDPGEAAPVLAAAGQGLRPVAILITHHHPDHIGGLAELRSRFSPFCVGPADDRIAGLDRIVGHGDRIHLDTLDIGFEVIGLPGHTLSHIAFHGEGLLFCGDTLFSLGCGRLFEGTPAQMVDSLDRIAALPDDTLVCCGHEYTLANAGFARAVDPDNAQLVARFDEAEELRAAGLPTLPSRLGDERLANPFLRVDSEAIRAGVAQHCGRMPAGRVDCFAELRRWKDGYRA
jgi:hydroxyacylglutathione hydrolase